MNKAMLGGKVCASVLGIIAGIVSAVHGGTVMSGSSGGFESNITYGGDAYTGIQNAGAQAANNVQTLTSHFNSAMGVFLVVFGLALIALFAYLLFGAIEPLLEGMGQKGQKPTAPKAPQTPEMQAADPGPVVPEAAVAEQAPSAPVNPEEWTCSNGHTNPRGLFCSVCGEARQQ